MSSTEIYYFSGTGNSYNVANDLSKKLNATLLPIIPFIENNHILTNADTIGLVFPIYDFKAPDIINTYIKKYKHHIQHIFLPYPPMASCLFQP